MQTIFKRDKFLVFVDLQDKSALPGYYIVPEWWIRNDIYETNQAYLAKHGGSRKVNPNSKHHSIPVKRIPQWKDRWDLLKLF